MGKTAPRRDSRAKSRGQAQYTIDKSLPGLLTAVIARPPVFGATLVSFDDSAARAIKGVVDVVQVPQGVAGLAKGFWAATPGRDAFQAAWDETTGATPARAEPDAEKRRGGD